MFFSCFPTCLLIFCWLLVLLLLNWLFPKHPFPHSHTLYIYTHSRTSTCNGMDVLRCLMIFILIYVCKCVNHLKYIYTQREWYHATLFTLFSMWCLSRRSSDHPEGGAGWKNHKSNNNNGNTIPSTLTHTYRNALALRVVHIHTHTHNDALVHTQQQTCVVHKRGARNLVFPLG